MHQLSRLYENTTVAVTGGHGYIGAALRAALASTPARVLVVSRQHRPPVPGTESLVGDIRTRGCWENIVHRADIVFHLAGNTSVQAAALDPAASLASTVMPLTHLAAVAQNMQRPRRMIYASTATVYGLTDRLPVGEDTETNPITNYDLHKRLAEQRLELASGQGILEGVSLRLANVYGPSPGLSGADDRGILSRVAVRALDGLELLVYGGGRYLRDYIYIDDVVRAFLVAGVHPRMTSSCFNVASGSGTTVRDAFALVVEQAERCTGRRSRLRDAPWPDDADRIEQRSFVADIRRIGEVCGWTPRVSLSDGIGRLVSSLGP